MTTTGEKTGKTSNESDIAWIKGLAGILRASFTGSESKMRTTINAAEKDGKIALFVPSEMAELQPANLRYLHTLAEQTGCQLVEDRRAVDITPILEKRVEEEPRLAEAVAELLQQSGMPGAKACYSNPQRLSNSSLNIPVPELIEMAAYCVDKSKHVTVKPEPSLASEIGGSDQKIQAHACQVLSAKGNTTLSYFSSPRFKCIGYIANNQFVAHVFLGGGSIRAPKFWTSSQALLKNRFRFQLFQSTKPGQDFGLVYNSFYLDLAKETSDAGTPELTGT